jgi:hypothetical protein
MAMTPMVVLALIVSARVIHPSAPATASHAPQPVDIGLDRRGGQQCKAQGKRGFHGVSDGVRQDPPGKVSANWPGKVLACNHSDALPRVDIQSGTRKGNRRKR